MRFSILVPVYNVEKYLKQCLDSILSQTFTDYEVILADDGSTDSSGKICDEYVKKYPDKIKVFHKENEGLLLTRRFSLKKAQGEYIVFVDSDDYVSPDLLQVLDQNFTKHGCDMVIYNFNRFVDGEDELTSPSIPYADETIFEGDSKTELCKQYILKHTFVNMWVKSVKREIVDIDADYTKWNVARGEDIIQSFALFDNASKILFIDNKLYYYRKNEGSVTLKVALKDYKSFLTHSEKTFQYIDIWNMSELVGDFAAKEMSHFYTYLRNIARKAKHEKNKTLLNDTVVALGNDERFIKILKFYNPNASAKRLRERLKLLKNAFLNKKWGSVCCFIKLSNLIGG